MGKRSKGIAAFQIALVSIGIVFLGIECFIFGNTLSMIFSSEVVDVIAGTLILAVFGIICCFGCVVVGITTSIIALKQRKNDATKDKFSLVMLILGLVQTVLPILLEASVFILPNVLK